MFIFFEKTSFTAYYSNNVAKSDDKITEISVDFALELMAKNGVAVTRPNTRNEIFKRTGLIISTLTLLLLTIAALFERNVSVLHYIKLLQTQSTIIQVLTRLFITLLYKDDFIQLRKDIEQFWRIEDQPADERVKYQFIYRIQSRVFQIYTVLAYMAILAFHIKPFIGALPFYCWAPKDNPMVFWVISIVGLIFINLAVFVVTGSDFLFVTMSINVMNQFDLLRSKIAALNYDNLTIEEIDRQIDEYSRYHYLLLQYVEHIDKTFTAFFLVQYWLTAFGECTYIAAMTISNEFTFPDYLESICYLVIIAYQFAFYCVPLTEITTQADLVGDAIFHSRWYVRHGGYKSKLYFMMMRCQKGCEFTAGGFADMNRGTLITVFRLCLSVYTFVNTMMT